jgi:hypothetical protein
LLSAQSEYKSNNGSKELRDVALDKVHSDARRLLPMIQAKASSLPLLAEDIIISAGYDVKEETIRQKQQNAVMNTEISGTILATAVGGGPHNWQITQDQKAITTLEGTKQAHIFIPNLVVGQLYYVRNKKIPAKNEKFDWSDWIPIIVT